MSCFSGIGGLEGADDPVLVSEIDPDCQKVLRVKYPSATINTDIETLKPPKVDLVAGGWPCQDLSVAGLQKGLTGAKSRLLYDLLRVSVESDAQTLLAENVTNLLKMSDGDEFKETLKAMHEHGFPFVAWRVMNARQFGLPQHRTRVLIIASKEESTALSVFRELPELTQEQVDATKISKAAGFYWTAGIHSINYTEGYSPTVKIGSSLKIASPPAVHYGHVVRQLSAREALSLQGFDEDLSIVGKQAQYKMAGNAVPKPMGRWLFKGVEEGLLPKQKLRERSFQGSFFPELEKTKFGSMGLSANGKIVEFEEKVPSQKAVNLIDFLDVSSEESLSSRAAKGLLLRLERSGQPCPPALRLDLEALAKH